MVARARGAEDINGTVAEARATAIGTVKRHGAPGRATTRGKEARAEAQVAGKEDGAGAKGGTVAKVKAHGRAGGEGRATGRSDGAPQAPQGAGSREGRQAPDDNMEASIRIPTPDNIHINSIASPMRKASSTVSSASPMRNASCSSKAPPIINTNMAAPTTSTAPKPQAEPKSLRPSFRQEDWPWTCSAGLAA